jgi:uncharacterized membrane protein YdjX (TVP38/TMEM64 family)
MGEIAGGRRQAGSSGTPRRYLLVMAAVFGLFLAIFLALRLLSVPAIEEPASLLRANVLGAFAGLALLIVEVVLPVPSSLVMMALGALFGIFAGACLSLLGSVGAALVGYGLGRWAGPSLLRWACSDAERARADQLIARWGMLAVAASRPVPLVAETIMVAAGASRLGIGRTLLAALLGALPASVIFATAGAIGLDTPSGFLVFGAAVGMSCLLWFLGRGFHRAGA